MESTVFRVIKSVNVRLDQNIVHTGDLRGIQNKVFSFYIGQNHENRNSNFLKFILCTKEITCIF